MPKISAVMALYNTPYDLLSKTLESILNQTYSDFELLIIDDASSTDYESFLAEFRDERIKYFKLEKNAGPGVARNTGIKKAIGEYIAIVDSDDIYLPQKFEIQVNFLDKNPDISVLSGAFKQSNNGKIPDVLEDDKDIKASMLFNSGLTNAAAMFKKSAFVENNLFYPENINFGEDYSLWISAMFAGIKMANLNEVLMIYTRRQNQLSKTKSDSQISILKELYRKIFSNMDLIFSEQEIDLHYNIGAENFKLIESSDKISNWFDKVIEQNKNLMIFDEKLLFEKKNQALSEYEKIKNRLFKIKLGKHNFCISKQFKLSWEKR